MFNLLPHFDDFGLLPPGDYELTFEQLRRSHLVTGEATQHDPGIWDQPWREKLVNNAEVLVRQLWALGITEIFLDGSFVEDKSHPNDVDGYFECKPELLYTGSLEMELNKLDPNKVWTWDDASRFARKNYPKMQLPMWHKYRVELYPHIGQLSGIKDEFGNDLQFPAAFRKTRYESKLKGIIKIIE